MRKSIIGDDGEKEWLCQHGVGHSENVHTCDGCCQRKENDVWALVIERSDNGFILRGQAGEAQRVTVIEEEEEEGKELDAHIRLLYGVLEYFGLLGSKHDKYRIHITKKKQQ